MTDVTPLMNVQGTSINSVSNAEIDLDNVTLEGEVFPNGGVEEWYNPHSPSDFTTSRSLEKDVWAETTIFNEGSQSIGLEARAVDFDHTVNLEFYRSSQYLYSNVANLTLDIDWYLDTIGTPVGQDYIRLEIKLNYRNLYYYFDCETVYSNYTNNGFYEIAGPTQTWNHLHRNLTTDYFDQFNVIPTQINSVKWQIRTRTPLEYLRVFFDDVQLLNGSTPIYGGSANDGNFETAKFGTTDGWYIDQNNGPGDISLCSDSHSGTSSMNLSILTFDDSAYATASRYPEKLLTSDNQANLTFWWKLDNYVDTTHYTYARVRIDLENGTFQSNFYYYMFVGGSGTLPFIIMGNDQKFAVDGFNVTDDWIFFNRNIWEDFNSTFETENLWVDTITFEVTSSEDNNSLSLLIDDISFAPSILNDMDYEHQDAVGTPVQGWGSPPGPDQFTVTDFAKGGSKAGNLTLVDDYVYLDQYLHNIPFNSSSNLFLDFNVYIDTFNTSSQDYILFTLYFDEVSFTYVIANSSSAFEDDIGGEEGSFFIILQEPIVTGQWLNFRLDLDQDYETLFGSAPDTFIYGLNLMAEAGADSELMVFFDDLYIYSDDTPAEILDTEGPTISLLPINGATVNDIVSIEWNVSDSGSGVAWSQLLIEGVEITNTTIETVGVSWDTTVIADGEYNITIVASDNAGNINSVTHILTVDNNIEPTTTTPTNTTSTTTPTSSGQPGNLDGVIIIVVVIAIVGVVFILYIFIGKKR